MAQTSQVWKPRRMNQVHIHTNKQRIYHAVSLSLLIGFDLEGILIQTSLTYSHCLIKELRSAALQICYVLYPGDATVEGKLLRLKQQYTLCSASIQDMIARFKEWSGGKVVWANLPTKVAIQMNDTHPTLSVPELMRILLDLEGLSWDQAWKITQA